LLLKNHQTAIVLLRARGHVQYVEYLLMLTCIVFIVVHVVTINFDWPQETQGLGKTDSIGCIILLYLQKQMTS